MINSKLYPPWPWFMLTALMGLVPVLNNKYPQQFFPVLSPWWVEVLSVFAGVFFATVAFKRGWTILEHRSRARVLVKQTVEIRNWTVSRDSNEVGNASRYISRLVRNSDEDLKEIRPDFTLASLKRLQAYIPVLLMEIETLKDAQIRVGVVGTYLGETFCRNLKWKWFFQTDPAMDQFGFLCSVLQSPEEDDLDPYQLAADLLVGMRKVGDLKFSRLLSGKIS
jgi:hypothetical protein